MIRQPHDHQAMKIISCLCALITTLIPSGAAVISWNSPVDVNTADPTQVNTTYTSFAAASIYSTIYNTTVNVNGVSFAQNSANLSLTFSLGQSLTFGSVGTTNYDRILSCLAYNTNAQAYNYTIKLSNLTNGVAYQVQIWTPFWNAQYPSSFSTIAPTVTAPVASAPDQSAYLNTGYHGCPVN